MPYGVFFVKLAMLCFNFKRVTHGSGCGVSSLAFLFDSDFWFNLNGELVRDLDELFAASKSSANVEAR